MTIQRYKIAIGAPLLIALVHAGIQLVFQTKKEEQPLIGEINIIDTAVLHEEQPDTLELIE